MGSYATLVYKECNEICIASEFDHKFFGYITDDECMTTESYKYLNDLCGVDVLYLNEPYIGGVCELSKTEAEKFMSLYAKDYCDYYEKELKETYQDWSDSIAKLPNNLKFILCFD